MAESTPAQLYLKAFFVTHAVLIKRNDFGGEIVGCRAVVRQSALGADCMEKALQECEIPRLEGRRYIG
jgi:hypothetical protein